MKTKPHKWIKLKISHFPWAVCACCGLVRLKNEKTEAAVRASCDS